jgi:hypothetical protein
VKPLIQDANTNEKPFHDELKVNKLAPTSLEKPIIKTVRAGGIGSVASSKNDDSSLGGGSSLQLSISSNKPKLSFRN